MVAKDPAYLAVEGNKFGSRPRELFEDVIEKLEEDYDKDRALMKEVYRGSTIVVTTSTKFEDFKNAMEAEDERMKEASEQNV